MSSERTIIDTHHHIFEPDTFPYSPSRHLTPPKASIVEYERFKEKHGIGKSVLVHGLSYGNDCSSLRSFINALDSYSENAMRDLTKQKEMLIWYAERLRPWNWSIDFLQLDPNNWEASAELIPTFACEHRSRSLCSAQGQEPCMPGSTVTTWFRSNHEALRAAGNFWVKLSAPYRCSDDAPEYADMKELVRALVDANPRRILWGSDWPHTQRMKVRSPQEALQSTPFLEVDDSVWLRSLKGWLTDEEWRLIMVENPTRLYDF